METLGIAMIFAPVVIMVFVLILTSGFREGVFFIAFMLFMAVWLYVGVGLIEGSFAWIQ